MEQQIFTPYAVDLSIRTYCGPTVLRLLTGKTKEEIHRDVNKLKRKSGKTSSKTVKYGWKEVPWKLTNAVRGVAQAHMEKLLNKYGMKTKWSKKIEGKKQTLTTFAADWAHVKKPIVIVTGCHYVLLTGGKVYDTFSPNGEIPAAHHFGKTRVTEYWVLDKVQPIALEEVTIPALPLPSPPKKDIKLVRFKKAQRQAKLWESKSRRAAKLAKKWAAKVKRYEKLFEGNDQ